MSTSDYDTIAAGRELDRLVGERVMGLVVSDGGAELNCWIPSGLKVFPKRIWQPSTNISDAWEVVERLSANGKTPVALLLE